MSCSRYVSLIIVPALPSIKVDAILDEWCATGRPKISHFGYNGAICVPSYCQLMTKLRSEAACQLATSFVIIGMVKGGQTRLTEKIVAHLRRERSSKRIQERRKVG